MFGEKYKSNFRFDYTRQYYVDPMIVKDKLFLSNDRYIGGEKNWCRVFQNFVSKMFCFCSELCIHFEKYVDRFKAFVCFNCHNFKFECCRCVKIKIE